jgi:hypothetical protein
MADLTTLISGLDRVAMTTVDLDDLDSSAVRIAQDMDQVGQLLARAKADALTAKQLTKVAEGHATLAAPAACSGSGVKPTVANVGALVATCPDVLAAHRDHAQAEEHHSDLRTLFAALETKASMLISLGATQRSETRGSSY